MEKNSTKSSVPAFGMKDKVGYMFGDFGNDSLYWNSVGKAGGQRSLNCHCEPVLKLAWQSGGQRPQPNRAQVICICHA